MEEREISNVLYKTGGFSSFVLGVAYVIITILYLWAGVLTDTPAHKLEQIAQHDIAWWLILSLSILTDFLFIPLVWTLYKRFKNVNINLSLLGAFLIGLFVILDLTITWPSYGELIAYAKKFNASSDAKARDLILIESNHLFFLTSSKFFSIYAILVPALGIWVFGLLMRKTNFSKATSWTGIITGILGTVTVIGSFFLDSLETAVVLTSLFATIWIFMTGKDLLQI